MQEFTGVKFIAEYFRKSGIKHVFGIPGHGNAAIVDELIDYSSDIQFVPIKHEQWGGHMADGYFRANRKVPAVVTTSVGPGATNLATALATAYVDSSTFIALTGEIQTYFFGMGIFQEIERQNSIDYINAMRHLAKRTWLVSSMKQLPRVLQNAHREALSGRPGPVLIDLPMELQVEKINAKVPEPPVVLGRLFPDPASVRKAAELLLSAERPLILIGGGVVMSDAQEELLKLQNSWELRSLRRSGETRRVASPKIIELYVFSPGNVGSLVANKLALEADVILAVGTTFSDETTSSVLAGCYVQHTADKVDSHGHRSSRDREKLPDRGRNQFRREGGSRDAARHPLAVGEKSDYHKSAHYQRVKELKDQWFNEIEDFENADADGDSKRCESAPRCPAEERDCNSQRGVAPGDHGAALDDHGAEDLLEFRRLFNDGICLPGCDGQRSWQNRIGSLSQSKETARS